MCVYIGIEDLVANALIELVEKNADRRVVFFRELDEYGAMVVKYLNENHEHAVLLLSKERTNSFLHDYSEFFELYSEDGKIDEGIRLKDGVTTGSLWERFRSYLTTDVLMAFMNEEALTKLGVNVA